MKLAYFTCLSPLKSGIVDYSEKELLPYLSKYTDIDIYIDDGYKPSNKDIINRFKIFNYKEIENRANQYDVILYHIGNNQFHCYMYETLMRHKGIVVLHDIFLHGLIWNMTINKEDKKRYIEEFKYCYEDRGRRIAEDAVKSGSYPSNHDYTMLKRILDNSLGVIVHSEFGRNIVLKEKKDINVIKINHPLTISNNILDKNVTREKLGIDKDTIVIATFGYIFPHKRINKSIIAFAKFHRKFPNSKYFLIGQRSYDCTDLDSLIDKLGVKKSVTFTGFLSLEKSMEHISASDICVNLRYPTAGETSGSILRILSIGRPVITSDTGWFSELPDSCSAKVDIAKYEDELLLEYLNVIAPDKEMTKKMGENAREYILNEYNPEKIAQEYYAFINNTVGKQIDIIKEISNDMADMGIRETDDSIIRETVNVLKELNIIDCT